MKLVAIYKCLCDETRLRILHLLSHRPLCVCHFQDALDVPQVKVSKHLAYLREHQMVETRREGTWMVYSLPAVLPAELQKNMQCLQDCCRENPMFAEDLRRMTMLLSGGSVATRCGKTGLRSRAVEKASGPKVAL